MSNKHKYDANQKYDDRYSDQETKSSSSKHSKRDSKRSKDKRSKKDIGDDIIMTDVYDRRGYSSEDDNISKFQDKSNYSNKHRDSRYKKNEERYENNSKSYRNESNDVGIMKRRENHFEKTVEYNISESDQDSHNGNKKDRGTEKQKLKYSKMNRDYSEKNSKGHDIIDTRSKGRNEKISRKDKEYCTSESDQDDDKGKRYSKKDFKSYKNESHDIIDMRSKGRNEKISRKDKEYYTSESDQDEDKGKRYSDKNSKRHKNESHDISDMRSKSRNEKQSQKDKEYCTSESDQDEYNKNKRGEATEKERSKHSDKNKDFGDGEITERYPEIHKREHPNLNYDRSKGKSEKQFERDQEHNTFESDEDNRKNKRRKTIEKERSRNLDMYRDLSNRGDTEKNFEKNSKYHRNESYDNSDLRSKGKSGKHFDGDLEYGTSESDVDYYDVNKRSGGNGKDRSKYSKKDMDIRDRENTERYSKKDSKSHRNESDDLSGSRGNRRSEWHFEGDQGYNRSKSHRDEDDENERFAATEKNEQNRAIPLKSSDEPQSKRVQIQTINMRTGGAYIPPAKLKMMQDQIKDKGSLEFQRIAWEALKKSIVGMTNKVNASNIIDIVPELMKENIIRGRGVLARAVMQAQAASPTFTRVYAALVAIINTKFPEIGDLILKRLILQYRRGFRRNDKVACLSAVRFIAHLFNQEVAHEIIILEIATHLLENPTEDSVEIAIALLKESGEKLTLLSKNGIRAITDRIRSVLHDHSELDLRIRQAIEVFFATQKDKFKEFEAVPKELDLVEESDKYTHLLNLDDEVDAQDILNVFKFDPNYEENEEKYKSVVKEILGDSSESEESGDESDENDDGGEGGDGSGEKKAEEGQQIIDMTETNIVCLRRKIYLTIQSSLDFEECAHKLLKLELKPGQIVEMCYMILDCCAQQRTYEKFFGLLAQRFCQINKVYAEPFTEIFENSYKTIHRLETNKLRNVANFFAHLLYTDAISWIVLSNIRLNEDDTTSSSRVFIKILFQELCEYMGLTKLNGRIQDVTFQEAFDGLFPRDHPHNTRFAINFFTSIGLGGLTDELREHLKNVPKKQVIPDVDSGMQEESFESDNEPEKIKKSKKHKKKQKQKKEKRRRNHSPTEI